MDPSDWVTPNWDLWYHVVTTYDSAGLATIYLDSAVNRTQQDTGLDHSIVDKGDGGYNLAVGIGIYANSDYTPGGTGTSSAYSHDGLIDEVAIYDNALSPEEVEKIYTEGPLYCGMTGMTLLKGDISGPTGLSDCYIDLYDLAAILENWLECTDPFNPAECAP